MAQLRPVGEHRVRIEVLNVGCELLTGATRKANVAFVARKVFALGFGLDRITVVCDGFPAARRRARPHRPSHADSFTRATSLQAGPRPGALRFFIPPDTSYSVSEFPSGIEFIGWWPARYDAVEFGYTVFGTVTVTDAAPDRVGTVASAARLWSVNPLRRGATIGFAAPRAGRVHIDLFDVAGRRVRVLLDEEISVGSHELPWNGRTDGGSLLATGLYFIRIRTEASVATQKLVILD